MMAQNGCKIWWSFCWGCGIERGRESIWMSGGAMFVEYRRVFRVLRSLFFLFEEPGFV
jgi:hypothetical protein